MKTTLLIMAAGIGSRFGTGIKQLEPVDDAGHIIMDYSIHDAMEAGFNKVIFIIRKDLEKDFKEVIGNRIEKITEVEYAFQAIDNLPEGFLVPEGRTKPWGTGQAVLSCKGLLEEPFVVINADDYYGKEAFVKVHDYLVADHEETGKFDFCMAGFILGNTLSDNGAVTRGVCLLQYSRIAALYRSLILFKSDGCLVGEQREQSFFFLLYCLIKRCEAFIKLEHICFIFAIIERSEKAWVCRKGYSRWCRAGKRRRNIFECVDQCRELNIKKSLPHCCFV